MFCIGNVKEENLRLVQVAKECMRTNRTGEALAVSGRYGGCGEQPRESKRYSVVIDIGGHGVGLEFHEDPFVSYVAPAGTKC